MTQKSGNVKFCRDKCQRTFSHPPTSVWIVVCCTCNVLYAEVWTLFVLIYSVHCENVISPWGVGGLINPCKVLPPQKVLQQKCKVLISVGWKNSTPGKRGNLQDTDVVEERDRDNGWKNKWRKMKVELVPSSVHYVQLTAFLGGFTALVIRTRGQQAKHDTVGWLSELQTWALARKIWMDLNQWTDTHSLLNF